MHLSRFSLIVAQPLSLVVSTLMNDEVFPLKDEAYIFDIKMICGGYIYFSALSIFERFGDSNREFRKPSIFSPVGVSEALSLFGQLPPVVVNSRESYDQWLWGIVDEQFVQTHMSQWLKSKECIRSAVGVYSDLELVSRSTTQRSYRGNMKSIIIERDGSKCLRCGSVDQLTMQHVIPYSKGGETTSRNLVTLCKSCNEKLADTTDLTLYIAAGLHFDYDLSLLKNFKISTEIRNKALDISSNLIQTRCEIW